MLRLHQKSVVWLSLWLVGLCALSGCKLNSARAFPPTPLPLPSPVTEPTAALPPLTLRQLADRQGWLVGAAVDPSYFTNPQYTRLLETEFNGLVA